MSRLKKMKTGFISFGKTGSACTDWTRPMVGAMSAMSARNAGFQKLSKSETHIQMQRRIPPEEGTKRDRVGPRGVEDQTSKTIS